MQMSLTTEKLAGILKVLGDPNRLGIVMTIGKDSRSVTEIINITGLSQTLVSFHLRALRKAELVRTKRNGPFIHYSLSSPALMDFLLGLSKAADSKKLRTEGMPESEDRKALAEKTR